MLPPNTSGALLHHNYLYRTCMYHTYHHHASTAATPMHTILDSTAHALCHHVSVSDSVRSSVSISTAISSVFCIQYAVFSIVYQYVMYDGRYYISIIIYHHQSQQSNISHLTKSHQPAHNQRQARQVLLACRNATRPRPAYSRGTGNSAASSCRKHCTSVSSAIIYAHGHHVRTCTGCMNDMCVVRGYML